MKQIQESYETDPNYGGSSLYDRLSSRIVSTYKWAILDVLKTAIPAPPVEDIIEDDFVIIATDDVKTPLFDDEDCVHLLTSCPPVSPDDIFKTMLEERFISMNTIDRVVFCTAVISAATSATPSEN